MTDSKGFWHVLNKKLRKICFCPQSPTRSYGRASRFRAWINTTYTGSCGRCTGREPICSWPPIWKPSARSHRPKSVNDTLTSSVRHKWNSAYRPILLQDH